MVREMGGSTEYEKKPVNRPGFESKTLDSQSDYHIPPLWMIFVLHWSISIHLRCISAPVGSRAGHSTKCHREQTGQTIVCLSQAIWFII